MKIIIFRGELTNMSAMKEALLVVQWNAVCVRRRCCHQCFCFQNQITYFFGYFDPEQVFFQMMKISNFWGDMTTISAEKESPSAVRRVFASKFLPALADHSFSGSDFPFCKLLLMWAFPSSTFVLKPTARMAALLSVVVTHPQRWPGHTMLSWKRLGALGLF